MIGGLGRHQLDHKDTTRDAARERDRMLGIIESNTRQIEDMRKQGSGVPPVVSWLLVVAVVAIMSWLAIGLWPG